MAAIAELDQSLEALGQLKPPGVNKSRVTSITALFIQHVQVLIRKLLSIRESHANENCKA